MTTAQTILQEATRDRDEGRASDAVIRLDVLCRLEPALIEPHRRLIRILVELNRPAEAEAACLRALKDNGHPVFHFELGLILHHRGALREALAAFEAALAGDLREPSVFVNAADSAARLGLLDKAEDYARQALALNPRSASVCKLLVSLEHARGRVREALQRAWALVNVYYRPDIDTLSGMVPAAQVLNHIDALLPPDAGTAPRTLVYLFARSVAIGHITQELFYLKTLFQDSFDEIVLVVSPLTPVERINQSVFALCMRNVRVVETDSITVMMSDLDIGVAKRGNRTYLLWSYLQLFRTFHNHLLAGNRPRFLALTDDERAEGTRLLARMGVPEDARLVVLHVRTAGYYGGDTHFDFRNLDIRDYVRTIRHLTGRGYHVVRIGDRTMPRLPDLGGRVIDAPFSEHYRHLLEPAAIDRCDFMIASMSGPCSLARAMGKPVLALNAPPYFCNLHVGPELIAFRRCYDVGGPRPRLLSYAEILERGVCDFVTRRDYDLAGIRLESLGEDELVEITEEMIAFLADPAGHPGEFQRRFAALSRADHERRAADPGLALQSRNWLGYALPTATVSTRFCELHGAFLPG